MGGGASGKHGARDLGSIGGGAARRMSRRGFLGRTAAAGAVLGIAPIFESCVGSSGGDELRTYCFDLSHGDPAREYHLVAGKRRHALQATDSAALRLLRDAEPGLADVEDGRITHFVRNARFAGGSHQLCYVTSAAPGSSEWRIEAMFVHLPRSFERALVVHRDRQASCRTRVPRQRSAAALGASSDLGEDLCQKYSSYKTYFDTARSLMFHHPDVMSLDTATATYVLNDVVCSLQETEDLAAVIWQQLQPKDGSWAVQTPIIDDATGKPYLNTEGKVQYSVTWTQATSKAVGAAVLAARRAIQDDPSLGADVTARTTAAAEPGGNDELGGKLWLMRDGVPSVDASLSAGNLRAAADPGFRLALTNESTERGFRIASSSADATTRMVSVEVRNWYVRYLGLYVRYLDANGAALECPSEIKETLSSWQKTHSGTYDTIWGIIQPEMVVLGIPVEDYDHTFSFPVPEAASSVLILAGGLGTGTTDYPDTLALGAYATIVMDLAIPGLFLAAAAGAAYSSFVSAFSASAETLGLVALALTPLLDETVYQETNEPAAFMNLATSLGGILLKKLATAELAPLVAKLYAYLTEGEVIDAIPIVGGILSAIGAAGIAAQLGETAGEVVRSPKTFEYELAFTHDVTVTIDHDPQDTVGFPATAVSYEVMAVLDGATTRRSGRLPLTSFRQDQLTYRFEGLPQGGKVKFSVGFFAADGWVAGQGQTGELDNLQAAVSIQIKENLVPLNASTVYSHLQKTALDGSNAIVWSGTPQAPAPAPTVKQQDTADTTAVADLGITLSETYAAVGFTWGSSGSSIAQCGGTGTGHLHQFRTLSLREDPQSSETTSNCGAAEAYRAVFSLLATTNDNFYLDPTSGPRHLRQIRFAGPGQPATYDAPGSNLSFGRLNLSSSDLLLHPLRKLVSINSDFSVMEILPLPAAAVADAAAPVATTASGIGTRIGLLSTPVRAAMAADGTILVLEAGNHRVQAFDIGGNPVKRFAGQTAYTFALKAETEGVTYLDMAVEYAGYVYVLSLATASKVYRLDLYGPDGSWLSRTSGVNAGAFTIDFWRNVYTLNFETFQTGGIVSPSVSLWIPSVPST